jgi:hypothetical protein
MKHYVNKEFLLLLLFLGFINIPYFAPSFHFVPAHDTMYYASNFFYLYNEYFLNHEIPLWMPYNLYGSAYDFFLFCPMSLSLYFIAFLGTLLRIQDALFLFKLAALLDQLVLLVGVYSLSTRLFSHRLTRLLVCIGVIAVSGFWAIHLNWNLRMYYCIPLVLLALIKFYDTSHFAYLSLAGLLALLSLMGNGTYFPIFFLLFYGVFSLVLFLHKGRQVFARARTLLTPSCIAVSLILVVIAMVFFQFTLDIFTDTVSYSPGRDHVTGKSPLIDYFSTTPPTSIAHRLEILYAVPSTVEQTFYLGLIPLIFLGYALLKSSHHPILRAMCATAGLIFLLSLGALTFVAPVLYFLVPLFDYFRHIALVLTPVKLLLLLIAGFGVDAFLQADRHGSADRSIAWIGVGLLVGIVCLDVFAFRSQSPYTPDYHYQYEYPDIVKLKLFEFHNLALCLLGIFVCGLYLSVKARRKRGGVILIACFLIEITSYSYFLFFVFPITLPRLYKQENGPVAEYHRAIAMLESSFHIAQYAFQPERIQQEQTYQLLDQRTPILTRYYGEKYCGNYSAAYVDPCFQDFRIDYIPLGIDRLLRARLGIPLDIPLMSDKPPLPNHQQGDQPLLRAFGCDAPKLFLTTNVHTTVKLEDASNIIARSQDFDTVPIILGDVTQYPQSATTQPSSSKSPGTVRVNRFTANTLDVKADVSVPGGAWLIYLDAYHPGWLATVNGQPRKIFPANLAFKAIHLDTGQNDVRLRFTGNRISWWYAHLCLYLGVLSGYLLFGTVLYFLLPGLVASALKAMTRKRNEGS